MSTGAVTCPQARRTVNRRKGKSKTYASKEWKARVSEFVKGKSCEWCGSTENLLAHHPYRDTPDAIYQDLYLSGCVVLCNTCHFMFHRRHKRKCPVCREHWMDLDVDRCYTCHLKETPGLWEVTQEKAEQKELDRKARLRAIAEKRAAAKKKHPCISYLAGGRCKLSSIGCRCPFARTKALRDCRAAVPKKAAVINKCEKRRAEA
ncbi:MAG: hypothetical protein PHT99_08660 [Methanoregula sp.]|nr:hypothetical protein [Methanoregula sp.]